MQIVCENIGKKFKNEWIFRNLSFEFILETPTAIIGPNGSGKSTLMQALAGVIPVNEGNIRYFNQNKKINEEIWHNSLSFSAPYIELIEEFTLKELIVFHSKFKPLQTKIDANGLIKMLNLEKHENKQIKKFSSGMKQKLKLGLAFFSKSSVLLLDEPTANLDQDGFEWYKHTVTKNIGQKLIIISSNEPKEISFCENQINILNYK